MARDKASGNPHKQSEEMERGIAERQGRMANLAEQKARLERQLVDKRRGISAALANGDELQVKQIRRAVDSLASESEEIARALSLLREECEALESQKRPVLTRESIETYNEQGQIAARAALELEARIVEFRDKTLVPLSEKMRTAMNAANGAYHQADRLTSGQMSGFPRLHPSVAMDAVERSVAGFTPDSGEDSADLSLHGTRHGALFIDFGKRATPLTRADFPPES